MTGHACAIAPAESPAALVGDLGRGVSDADQNRAPAHQRVPEQVAARERLDDLLVPHAPDRPTSVPGRRGPGDAT
jgi:hypothetical protein